MAELSTVRDLVVVGVVGYVAYKFLNKDGIIPTIKENIYTSGVTTGETMGKIQSELQTQAYLIGGEFKNPEYLIDPTKTPSVIQPVLAPVYQAGFDTGEWLGKTRTDLISGWATFKGKLGINW